MATNAICLTQSLGMERVSSNAGQVSVPGASFADVLRDAGKQLDQLQSDAEQKVNGLLRGDGTDIHTAMIATQKADLSFELALAVRNKAVNAYQQLMATQF